MLHVLSVSLFSSVRTRPFSSCIFCLSCILIFSEAYSKRLCSCRKICFCAFGRHTSLLFDISTSFFQHMNRFLDRRLCSMEARRGHRHLLRPHPLSLMSLFCRFHPRWSTIRFRRRCKRRCLVAPFPEICPFERVAE